MTSMRSKHTLPSLVLAGALLWAGQALALDKGASAPAFDLQGVSGPVSLAAYQGKLVYVDFWASWCGPCRQSFPWMNEMQAKYGAQGLQVVAINLDAKNSDARAFLEANPAQFAVAFDPAGGVPRGYGLKGMPSSYLIGKDGKLIMEHMGFKAADRAVLEEAIKSALGPAK
ncbi:MAG: TlpA disulfide reductase family protein [Pseudomonadota bacterium]